MNHVLFALWILMWGAVGYFTVRAIQMHIEKKRIEKAMVNRVIDYADLELVNSTTYVDNQVVYNLFEGIL